MTATDYDQARLDDAVVTSKKAVDLLIIGGGMAGASLGRSMAMAGKHVLIIEKEIKFRDRIRGELVVPWGSVEAKELGIYDILLRSCAAGSSETVFLSGGRTDAAT